VAYTYTHAASTQIITVWALDHKATSFSHIVANITVHKPSIYPRCGQMKWLTACQLLVLPTCRQRYIKR
jgi:hypothetical protein